LLRCALGIVLTAIAILPVSAQNLTVVSRSGPYGPNLGLWSSDIATAQYVSWSQAAGTQFSSVVIYAALCSYDGNPATGVAYLTNSIGPGTTASNQIGPALSFTVPGTQVCQSNPLAISHPYQLNFGNINLPAPTATTYYLVVYDGSANLGWIFSTGGTAEEACDTTSTTACPNGGVSTNNDGLATTSSLAPPAVPASYPPAGAFNPPSSPVKGLLFTVAGNAGIPVTTVPTLSAWAFTGAIFLFVVSGLFLARRRYAHG
jgi:hypothetical protein